MASFVLDTHACVFALTAPRKLGKRAASVLRRMDAGRDEVWLPAAVVAEVVLLRELGRTHLGLPELTAAMRDAPSLRFAPMDLAQLDEYAALTAIRDPFDRLIVGAARALGAKLITKDQALAGSPLVETVWD